MNKNRKNLLSSTGSVILLAALIANQTGSIAQDEAKKAAPATMKKSMSEMLKCCSEREQRSSDAISKLIDKASDAEGTDDPNKMKAALQDLRKSLADLKADHEKSGDLLKKVHRRMEDLKKQIKVTKQEHDKASGLLEDEDMDDVIWAY